MPEPTRDRPSRNYEFLFLFSKQPNYYFNRSAIDVPARSSSRNGVRTNPGSVWETHCEILSDSVDDGWDGLWRVTLKHPHTGTWRCGLVHWSGKC